MKQTVRTQLPFSFAKQHGMVVSDDLTEGLELSVSGLDSLSINAVHEARRYLGSVLKVKLISDDDFEESETYYLTHKKRFDDQFGIRLFSTLKRLAKKNGLSDSYLASLLEAATEEGWAPRELISQIESL